MTGSPSKWMFKGKNSMGKSVNCPRAHEKSDPPLRGEENKHRDKG